MRASPDGLDLGSRECWKLGRPRLRRTIGVGHSQALADTDEDVLFLTAQEPQDFAGPRGGLALSGLGRSCLVGPRVARSRGRGRQAAEVALAVDFVAVAPSVVDQCRDTASAAS